MEWREWLIEVGIIRSREVGSSVNPDVLDSGIAREWFSEGKTPQEFADYLKVTPGVPGRLAGQNTPFPVGAVVSLAIFGILIWNCGGTFGLPFGPGYSSPEEKAKNRAAYDAQESIDRAESERKRNPLTYLDVKPFEWSKSDSGLLSIVAEAKNISSKRLSYASISYKLKDKEGRVVGSASDFASNLDPGDVWRIEATVIDDNVATAELDELAANPVD